MAFRIFTIPVHGSEAAEQELNAFLRGHRVLSIEKRWVEDGTSSFWCLCVDFLDASAVSATPHVPRKEQGTLTPRQRVDYREILKPDEFAVFLRLREWRKKTAEKEGVPLFALFTNEQLANMVQSRMTTKADLGKLSGVGEARLDKYAAGAMEILTNAWSTPMKRAGQLLDAILDRENLRRAYHLASRGNADHPDVLYLRTHLQHFLQQFADQVRDGSFSLGRVRQFVILDPKERLITAPCFEERILHHAIMNIVEPHFERRAIFDSYACRVGKGRDRAVERAVVHAVRYGHYLKFDVRRYFDSIDHERLLSRLARCFKDAALLALLERIVRAFRGNLGRGLPIGSLMSQHLANYYLDALDRFAKETLRLPGYVRYMDDVAIWSDDPMALAQAEAECRSFLHEHLGLAYKPEPYRNRTGHGMDFLGCRVFPHRAVLNRRSKVRFRRKLHHLETLARLDLLSEAALQQRATSLVACTRSAGIRSWKFRQAVLVSLAVDDPEARTA